MALRRALGTQGLEVFPIGLGCMGMTNYSGGSNQEDQDAESMATIAKALDLGINLFDTAWMYTHRGLPPGAKALTNEEFLGKAISIYGREKFVIATKFGQSWEMKDGKVVFKISGSEETIMSHLADSLKRLGTDYIDLYYMHRMDLDTPIEETMHVLKRLVQQGTIRYIGLSECSASELRRAHAVHPITAIQMEWSLNSRDIETDVVPVARELGVGIVPYSPLGRGMLSGTIRSLDQLAKDDARRMLPRFANIEQNSNQERFYQKAIEKGCSPAQLALAWVLAQGSDVVPIPGTKSCFRVEENVGAIALAASLTAAEVTDIGDMIEPIVGDRYPDMSATHGSRA